MLVAAQSSDVSSSHHQLIQCTKSSGCRRPPLQPKTYSPTNAKPLNRQCPYPNIVPSEIVIWVDEANESDKENAPPVYSTPTPPAVKKVEPWPMEALDVSLADELSAIRQRLQRVKIDGEKTEKLLEERGRVLDLQMTDILNRGEVQKQLEMELDRLYRLKEIKLACQVFFNLV